MKSRLAKKIIKASATYCFYCRIATLTEDISIIRIGQVTGTAMVLR